jgi:hypothetical protein
MQFVRRAFAYIPHPDITAFCGAEVVGKMNLHRTFAQNATEQGTLRYGLLLFQQ